MKYFFLIILLAFISFNTANAQYRTKINLQGQWQFALDTANIGVKQKWFLSDLNDVIQLHGTTDSNHKGFRNKDTTIMHLNRVYKYEGIAWYRKKIIIPESCRNKHLEL